MTEPTYISDYWWYYYLTPYGTFKIEYHFIFLVDQSGPQMVHLTFYNFIGGAPPPLFFPCFGPIVVVGHEEGPNHPPFFYALEHLIP